MNFLFSLLGPETEHNPVGFLSMETFLCFPFLLCRVQTPASMTFPELQRAGSGTEANQGREGMQGQGRSSQETIVQPLGSILILPQGMPIIISLSSSAKLKPPINGRQTT